jgi:hypothetical protein
MGVLDDRWGLGSYVKLARADVGGGAFWSTPACRCSYSAGGWTLRSPSCGWWHHQRAQPARQHGRLERRHRHDRRRLFHAAGGMSGQYLVGALAAALAGACAGFLIYNWNPAHIFMGDAGSLFLGFMLAAVAIKLRFPSNSTAVTWMIPLLVLALPIFDTTPGLCQPAAPWQEPADDAGQGSHQPPPGLSTGQPARGGARLLSALLRLWSGGGLCFAGDLWRGVCRGLRHLRAVRLQLVAL